MLINTNISSLVTQNYLRNTNNPKTSKLLTYMQKKLSFLEEIKHFNEIDVSNINELNHSYQAKLLSNDETSIKFEGNFVVYIFHKMVLGGIFLLNNLI